MVVFHFNKLRRKKEFDEGRDLPMRLIAKETGLSLSAIAHISNPKKAPDRLTFKTLNTLCSYFGLSSMQELVEYTPDDEQAAVREQS